MIKYRSIIEANDCPFYTEDNKKQKICFLKYSQNINAVNGLVESPSPITKTKWQKDCGGNWSNCCFVSLLYDTSIAPDDKELEYVDTTIDEFDPYTEESDNEEEEEEIPQEIPQEIDNNQSQVVVKINKVSDPYRVKADVLVYPTNTTLLIDDPLLNRHSRFKIQDECDVYVNKLDIKMGAVYPTSNGGNHPDGVVPKKIYHAVVAGESRLVSHNIQTATMQSLILADSQKQKIVLMIPFDCGLIDVAEAARIQLSAVKSFLDKYDVKNIERIHFIMEDDESIAIFKEYFDRIFVR